MEICEGDGLLVGEVAVALDPERAAAGDNRGEVRVVVDVGVADAGAVEEHRVIEERAFAVGRGFQALQIVGEERDVEGVDFRHAGDFFGVIAVVGQRVMRIGDAGLGGVGAVAGLAGELEGDDARDVALEGEDLEVEHELRVIGVGGGDAEGAVEVGGEIVLGDVGLGFLDTAFDLADGVEVFADFGLIGGAEAAFEAGNIFGHPVEEARAFAEGGAAFGDAAALAEEAFEDDTRVGFVGEGRGGRGPGEIVLVNAGVAVVALAGGLEHVHREFERGELGGLADLLGGELVGGGGEAIVVTLGVLGFGGAEEGGVGRGVGAGVGVAQLHVRENGELVAVGREGFEDRREGGERAVGGGGGPTRLVAAHGHEDVAEPAGGFGGGERGRGGGGDHRVEERERERGAHATEEGATGEGLAGEDGAHGGRGE